MALVLGAGSVAHWLRYSWIEAQGMGPLCTQQPQTWPCVPRQWVIELFLHQRLGWASVVVGVAAWVVAWMMMLRKTPRERLSFAALLVQVLGTIGAGLGAAGLVLYNADLSALGVVLGLMAVARASGLVQAEVRATTTAAIDSSRA